MTNPNEVRRWYWAEDGMQDCTSGDYVQADDYSRLLAERDALAKALDELVRFLEPIENGGVLDVPGLATLNRYRITLSSIKERTP